MTRKTLFPKIPKSVTILGADYKVVIEPLDQRYGECRAFEFTIALDPEQPLKEQWRTLFHEMKHAEFFRNGFQFCGIPQAMIEILCESHANMMIDLIEQKMIKL